MSANQSAFLLYELLSSQEGSKMDMGGISVFPLGNAIPPTSCWNSCSGFAPEAISRYLHFANSIYTRSTRQNTKVQSNEVCTEKGKGSACEHSDMSNITANSLLIRKHRIE